MLKNKNNNISKSKHYTKQSRFQGSKRQIRGQVIKLLVESPLSKQALQAAITDNRLSEVLKDLLSEQLVVHRDGVYSLG